MRVIIQVGFERLLLKPGVSADAVIDALDGAVLVDGRWGGNNDVFTPVKGQDGLKPPIIVFDHQILERQKEQGNSAAVPADQPDEQALLHTESRLQEITEIVREMQ